jgi:CheY-like chemotaxis protein
VAAPAQGALRVMVVDDNVDAADSLALLLQIEGHAVTVLYGAQDALRHAGEAPADRFLLDSGLPGLDGVELARRLRALPLQQGAMLVALTGYGQESDRERSREAGFDRHLVKPVSPETLREVLASVRPRHGEGAA